MASFTSEIPAAVHATVRLAQVAATPGHSANGSIEELKSKGQSVKFAPYQTQHARVRRAAVSKPDA